MKLKEYATKIKNRLVGQRAKPQEEEKDDLSEKIAERTPVSYTHLTLPTTPYV